MMDGNSEMSSKILDISGGLVLTAGIKALSVLNQISTLKIREIRSSGKVNGSVRDNGPESSEMDCSDVSDIHTATCTSSDETSEMDCSDIQNETIKNSFCEVNCLERYEDLQNRCCLLSHKFVDCSSHVEDHMTIGNSTQFNFSLRDVFRKNLLSFSHGQYDKEMELLPGSLVWAKLSTYPWWPAMVDPDPDEERYYRQSEIDGEKTYHCVFLTDIPKKVRRAWIAANHLTAYVESPKKFYVRKSLAADFKRSKNLADTALCMPIPERRKKFTFLQLYNLKSPAVKKETKVAKVPVRKNRKDWHKSSESQRRNPRRKCRDISDKKTNSNCNQKMTVQRQHTEPEGEVYEVDFIIDHKIHEGEKYYLVKWKDYAWNSNTWEPVYHMTGCQSLIYYYEALNSHCQIFNMKMFVHFLRDLTTRKPSDHLSISKVLNVLTAPTEDSINMRSHTTTYKIMKLKEFIRVPIQKLKCHKKDLLALMRYAEKRKHVLVNLKEWEKHIKCLNPATYIKVENDVDLEKAPSNFKFIQDYVSKVIEIDEEPPVFCYCKRCTSKSSCCPDDCRAHFAYNRCRRLQLLPGNPIYECNKCCKCGDDCVNRVVQHGSKIKVSIFRTSNGCGWGLKALETIQKGQFVMEYLGEILLSDEAEISEEEYFATGRSYLFNLNFHDSKYVVDARHFGNASRFINHSCEPNLHVFAVWINCQDPQLPRLAFFAKRKINRGEELTFDYKMFKSHPRGSSNNTEGKIACKCCARKCRKYLC